MTSVTSVTFSSGMRLSLPMLRPMRVNARWVMSSRRRPSGASATSSRVVLVPTSMQAWALMRSSFGRAVASRWPARDRRPSPRARTGAAEGRARPGRSAARPPLRRRTCAPVIRWTASERSGSCPTSSTCSRPSRELARVERAALQARARSPPRRRRAPRTRGGRSPRPGPWGSSGTPRSRRRAPRIAAPAARDWRSPFSVSRRSASGEPSSASPWRSSQTIGRALYPLYPGVESASPRRSRDAPRRPP